MYTNALKDYNTKDYKRKSLFDEIIKLFDEIIKLFDEIISLCEEPCIAYCDLISYVLLNYINIYWKSFY